VSWALLSETSITLNKVEGVRDGKSLFIDKTSKETWADVTGVKYYEGVGYYVSGYASSMGSWDVGKLTVVQFDGDSKDFVEKMAQARMNAK
jgi:hypothetical protein